MDLDWLRGALDIIEVSGQLLFPDRIVRVGLHGTEEIRIRIRPPSKAEILEAQEEAREICKARGCEGDDAVLGELDAFCLLARMIRAWDPPHGQQYTAEALFDGFDSRSLYSALERAKGYDRLIDPVVTAKTSEDVIEACGEAAKRRNLPPLDHYRWERAERLHAFYGVPACAVTDAQAVLAIHRDLYSGAMLLDELRAILRGESYKARRSLYL